MSSQELLTAHPQARGINSLWFLRGVFFRGLFGPCWSSYKSRMDGKGKTKTVVLISHWYIRTLLRFLQLNTSIVAVARVSWKWLKSKQQMRLGARIRNQSSRSFKFECEFFLLLYFRRIISDVKRPSCRAEEWKAVSTPQPLCHFSVFRHPAGCAAARSLISAEKEPAKWLILCLSITFFYLSACFELFYGNKQD